MTGAIVTAPFDVMKVSLQSNNNISKVLSDWKIFRQDCNQTCSNITVIQYRSRVKKRKYYMQFQHQFKELVWEEHYGILSILEYWWGKLYPILKLSRPVSKRAYSVRRIATEEGWKALFKGLGPTLVGIIPARSVSWISFVLWVAHSWFSRAINFYFYPTSKAYLAKQFPNAPTTKSGQSAEDSPVIHLGAAVIAGIMTATGTNPIWGQSTIISPSRLCLLYSLIPHRFPPWQDTMLINFFSGENTTTTISTSETSCSYLLFRFSSP